MTHTAWQRTHLVSNVVVGEQLSCRVVAAGNRVQIGSRVGPTHVARTRFVDRPVVGSACTGYDTRIFAIRCEYERARSRARSPSYLDLRCRIPVSTKAVPNRAVRLGYCIDSDRRQSATNAVTLSRTVETYDAIEHVDTERRAYDEIDRIADSHQIARLVGRQSGGANVDHLPKALLHQCVSVVAR